MGYRIGIDFGTTFTAAAVHRDGQQTPEVVPLGDDDGTATASVIFVAPDGSLVLGDAAVRQAGTDPDRVIDEVRRRIGDQTPVLVGGESIGAHTVAARYLRWVVDRVAEREGEPPSGVAVTHPASWGPDKRTLLADALIFAGVGEVTLVAEPEAAAIAYAVTEHVEPGSTIGVYDLDDATFDATVLRRLDGGGFERAGQPEEVDSPAGVNFDEAVFDESVFDQVRGNLGADRDQLDCADPRVISTAVPVRGERTDAELALAADTEVTVPVEPPGDSTDAGLVPAESEDLIGPTVDLTVNAVRRAAESAGLGSAELSAVLLVGGRPGSPLVAQRVSAELDLPVAVHPAAKAVMAVGASLAIAPAAAASATSAATRAATTGPRVSAVVRRRALVVLAGVAAGVVGLLVWTSGWDIDPGSDGAVAIDRVAPPVLEGPDRAVVAPKAALDPWTGRPYTETTLPGPTRPDAEPAQTDPAALTPAPTSDDRARLIAKTPSRSSSVAPPGPTGTEVPPTTTDPESEPPLPSESEQPPTSSQEPPPTSSEPEQPSDVPSAAAPEPTGSSTS